jgi:hypothetical protein
VVRCVECRRVWRFLNRERWRAYWIDDGPEEKLLFYCPQCSERDATRSVACRRRLMATFT